MQIPLLSARINYKRFHRKNPMTRKRTTIKDVSVLAGVSVSTVSRVLNASGPISEDTRKLVEAAATQLHYQPNPLA